VDKGSYLSIHGLNLWFALISSLRGKGFYFYISAVLFFTRLQILMPANTQINAIAFRSIM